MSSAAVKQYEIRQGRERGRLFHGGVPYPPPYRLTHRGIIVLVLRFLDIENAVIRFFEFRTLEHYHAGCYVVVAEI